MQHPGPARPYGSRPVRSVAVVADDLTSAGDGAVPFLAAGFPARILLRPPGGPPPGNPDGPGGDGPPGGRGPDHPDGPDRGVPGSRSAGVTALDLDTRSGTAARAAAATAGAVRRLAGADVLLKTADSTVRGHLAAELEAALAASGRRTAVVAPAFPAEGRTTEHGVQLLHGTPVHETAFARDPGHPVRDADLSRLLPGAVCVPAPVPGSRDPLAELVGRARVVVADAAEDLDLDRIAAAVPDPREVLWVGSPGLAGALARRLARHGGDGAGVPERAVPAGGGPAPAGAARARVLYVVGTLHPAGREQAAAAGESGAAVPVPVTAVAPDRDVPPVGPGPATARQVERAVERAGRALADRGAALLHGPAGPAAPGAVPAALAAAVAALDRRRAFDALVLTGGETARTVLLALGARTVRLTGQPEPGVPVGLLDRPRALTVAFKAGGFGDRGTLVRLGALLGAPAPGGGRSGL